MRAAEYKVEASRTLEDPFYTEDQKRRFGLHAAIGICTEVGELVECFKENLLIDCVNMQEEIGDCFWYLAIYERLFGFELETNTCFQNNVGFNGSDDVLFKLVISSSKLLDIYKKAVFYDREELEMQIRTHTEEVFQLLVMLLETAGRSVEKTRTINIAKLRKRFPEKFSKENAINRNLKAEREILEGRDANV